MKILKWLFYAILAIVAFVLILAAFLPEKTALVSTIKIGVLPDKVFHMIATYSNRGDWDPWTTTDSTAETGIEKKEGFTGSRYSWKGKKIGAGHEMIDSVDFGRHIKTKLSFEGMEGESTCTWDFVPDNDSTIVRWAFETEGAYPFGRIVLTVIKNHLKTSFDKGLQNLKTFLEKNGYRISTLTDIEFSEYPAVQTMGIKAKLKMTEIESVTTRLFTALMSYVTAEELIITGPPFAHYFNFNQQAGETEMIVAVPVLKSDKGNGQVVPMNYGTRKILKALHSGPYHELYESYEILMKYISDNNIKAKWESFETYLTDPSQEPDPLQWKTEIGFLVE